MQYCMVASTIILILSAAGVHSGDVLCTSNPQACGTNLPLDDDTVLLQVHTHQATAKTASAAKATLQRADSASRVAEEMSEETAKAAAARAASGKTAAAKAALERAIFNKQTKLAPIDDAGVSYRQRLGVIDWQYAPSEADAGGPFGPKYWSKVIGADACAEEGTQSPIDLVTANAEEMPSLGPIVPIVNFTCTKYQFQLSSNTALLKPDDDCKESMYVDFPVEGVPKRFYLSNVHVKSPSEHTLNGLYFPMEVHYLHTAADDDQNLIVAVMVGVGKPTPGKADYLDDILLKMPPANASDVSKTPVPAGNTYSIDRSFTSNPYEFLDLKDGYYYYDGSATSPSCDTNTPWIILPEPVMVGQETLDLVRQVLNSNPRSQMAPFGTIVGDSPWATPAFSRLAGRVVWNPALGSNNRPIQPLTGSDNPNRKLYHFS